MLQLCFRVTTPVTSLPFSRNLGQQIASAGGWFLHSGIISNAGGVARYNRFDTGNLPVSTEITGYTINALSWLYRVTGDASYLAQAEKTAKFLIENAWHPEYGLFPFELGYPLPPAYFFDCGIIIRGLLALWRVNKNQLLLGPLSGFNLIYYYLKEVENYAITREQAKAITEEFKKKWL